MSASGGSAGLGGSGQVNVAQAQAAAAAQDVQEIVSSQEASEMSMVKGADDVSNPQAATRLKKKEENFKTLSSRRSEKTSKGEEKKTEETGEKGAGEDLAEKFSHDDPDLASQSLKDLASSIGDDSSPEDIQKQVENRFPDPLQQQKALDYLIQSTPAGPKQNNLIRAKLQNAQQNAQGLRGGLNVKLASLQAAQLLNIPGTQLRALYNQVTNTEGDAENLEGLLAGYSPEEMPIVMKFLVDGMSSDLKAEASSIEKPKLKIIFSKLCDFQALNSTKAALTRDFQTLESQAKLEGASLPPSCSALQLIKAFFSLVAEKFISATKVLKSVELVVGPSDLGIKNNVLQIFYKNIKDCSSRIISSAERRQNLASAILNALDTINAENEDYPKPGDFPKPPPFPTSSFQGVNFAGTPLQQTGDGGDTAQHPD